jgi:hypothetical protein
VRAVSKPRAGRAARRLRRLAALGALIGLVAAVRRVLLDRDQRVFEDRYGPSSAG